MARNDTLIQDAKARAQMYHFLAAVYLAPPTPALVEELRKLGLIDTDDLENVKREFNDLFVVPLGRYTTPYEAVYRDEREIAGERVRGLLMGPSTVDVIGRYKAAGAEMDQMVKELPDHVGVELAFMGFLCERESDALKNGDESLVRELRTRQAEFLNDHLQPWVPLLAQRIREKARIEFYKGLASLTEDTVRESLEFLGGDLGSCEQSSIVS